MAQSALLVADYLLSKGRALTILPIIKLVYISHGWTLGLTGRPLIAERVEAWRYGPVIPVLYHRFKKYRHDPIDRLGYCGTHVESAEVADRNKFIEGLLTRNERRIVDRVLDRYGGLTANQLSNLTHQKGTPWEQCYVRNTSAEIPNPVIEEHYRDLARA